MCVRDCLLTRWFLAQLAQWCFFTLLLPLLHHIHHIPHLPRLLLRSLWTSSVLRRENKPRRGTDRRCITVDFRPVNQRKRLLWRRRSISCPPNNIFLGLGDKAKVFTLLWLTAWSVCFYFVPTCPTCTVCVVYFCCCWCFVFFNSSLQMFKAQTSSSVILWEDRFPFFLTCCSVNLVLVPSLNSEVNPFPEVLLSRAKS